jgi:WD40 repeat protein
MRRICLVLLVLQLVLSTALARSRFDERSHDASTLWEKIGEFPSAQRHSSIAFSSDGRFFAYADAAGATHVVSAPDLAKGVRQSLYVFPSVRAVVHELAFSRDGRRLVALRTDGVMAWDLATGAPHRAFQFSRFEMRGATRTRAKLSGDGSLVAIGYQDARGVYPVHWLARGTVVYDTDTGATLKTLQGTDYPNAFSSDSRFLATLGPGPNGRIWDLTTGKTRHNLKVLDTTIGDAAFSADGGWLAVPYWGYGAVLVPIGRRGDVRVLIPPAPHGTSPAAINRYNQNSVAAIRFCPSGRYCALGRPWGIHIADAVSTRTITELRFDAGLNGVQQFTFSPDGTMLAAAGDKALLVWTCPPECRP